MTSIQNAPSSITRIKTKSSTMSDTSNMSDDQDLQHTKKKMKKLDFSIESIMQSSTDDEPADEEPSDGQPSDEQPSDEHTNDDHQSELPATSSASLSALAQSNQITCQLDNKDMWDKFHSLNTEMIITKTGRRMFPVMKVQFSNLNPAARYSVAMDIVPVDNKRYRYAYHKSCWQVAGKADPSAETRLYMHPDSPFSGDLLTRQVISFEKVKLTNNEMDKTGHIILNSMHKYQPRVYLIELKSPPNQHQSKPYHKQAASLMELKTQPNQHQSQLYHKQTTSKQSYDQANHNQHQQSQPDIECYKTFVFPETVFTAVTAYQNQLITKMKIDKNPFAKGFRDSSRLSDLDRNDSLDYMSSSARFTSAMAPFLGHSSLDHHPLAASAASRHLHSQSMDAYQLLAANNPWYSAAAMAAAAGANLPMIGPSNSETATPTSTTANCDQANQLSTIQMWLAAFSACLNGSGRPPSTTFE